MRRRVLGKEGSMKNGEMSVKRKIKKPVQQAEKQSLEQEGSGAIRADYRTEACQESFICAHCGREIHPEGAGSNHRNHCPYCLYSLHVDEEAGDRSSSCRGEMEPIAIVSREDGDWSILHRCKRCGKLNLNRALADDNPVLLTSLAARPLAFPPFPLSYLEKFLDGKV